ncbi:chorismate synthase [Fusibacter bizertensis]|jgi:chorismate synthase (EC 4.2.3.5)|uniref:Chorismate synthase n=1 Tax=Fusibacter bizertensis TaxID=1488331 RepID=A0ABT6NC03_9FIRM|nr:chorismate synthase [Fusibacter bizertensis]MDH8677947.1 chorismate synthase [Fusibacter bizertensis]
MSSSFGKELKISLFGESHGTAIGCVIDGLPPKIKLDLKLIEKRMLQRKPGQSKMTTPRAETDQFEILSGIFEGKTTGGPLCIQIRNADRQSDDYEELKKVFRPGHADYVGYVKSMGAYDPRGGGHFSARLTAPLVFAGAIAEQILAEKGIKIVGHIKSIGQVNGKSLSEFAHFDEELADLDNQIYNIFPEELEAMLAEVDEARIAGDSVGASVEVSVYGLPVGLGSPFFDTVEGKLAHALFAIPAVKGVEFGDGFTFAHKRGSEVIDAFVLDHQGNVQTNANHNGGINGGITNGMPLLFKCGFKPTASISMTQETLNFNTKEMTNLKVKGRHDPCVAMRAVPIVKAMAAIVLLDLLIENLGVGINA